MKIILVGVLAILLGACASPARVSQMTVSGSEFVVNEPISKQLKNNIALIEVTGGESTNPMWTSEIGNQQFKIAIEKSLMSAKLLNALPASAGYQLKVNLAEVQQPVFGLDFTVTASVEYQLTNSKTGLIVLKEKITRPFTATLKDAFMGVERLRMANEGAAKVNIEEFIKRLYLLKI